MKFYLPREEKKFTQTNNIKHENFSDVRAWWNNRIENDNAWFVTRKEIEENSYNLDFKHTKRKEDISSLDTKQIIGEIKKIESAKNKLKQKVFDEVNSVIENKSEFKTYKIGDFLNQVKDKIDIDDSTLYQQVTVKMNGKGVSLRGRKKGADIGTKRQFLISEGQFILSRIDARNSAYGLVPKDLQGAIVTGDFPVFDINTKLIDKKFFNYLMRSKQILNACILSSKGTTNRKRLKEDIFLSIEMELPPLAQQKIIAELLEKITILVTYGNTLTANYNEMIDSLVETVFSDSGSS